MSSSTSQPRESSSWRSNWSLHQLIHITLDIVCTSIFFFMTLTSYFRSSDLYNDMLGVTQAAYTIHHSILPLVDYPTVAQVYGQPYIADRYDLSSSGVSVQLKLQAMTEILNQANGSGSALFFATSWGYPALGVNASSINRLCTQSLQTNTTVRLNNSKTAVAMKKNLVGYQASDWTGIDETPLTIKATTDAVELGVVPNLTAQSCIYQLRLRHLEAFELFDPSTATFNVMEAYFVGTGTPSSIITWRFNPHEHRFNWFYYFGRIESNNVLALICQVVGLLLIGLANERSLTFAYQAVEAGLKRIDLPSKSKVSTLFAKLTQRALDVQPSPPPKLQIESAFNRKNRSDPLNVDSIYYNSLLVNVVQVYLLYSKRFILFRTVNALDFFLTANWGFDHMMMNIQYANIMSGIFWFVLLTQKIVSCLLYVFVVVVSKAMRRKASRSTTTAAIHVGPVMEDKKTNAERRPSKATSTSPSRPFVMKRIALVDVICKEIFRPNPELIVFIMFFFPKFFYAGFYGGATKWVPIEQSNLSALASNLGGSLLVFNLVRCSLCMLPLNGIYLLLYPRSLYNGFVQSRLPGKVYTGLYYVFQEGKHTVPLTFQEYNVSSTFSMLTTTWQQGLPRFRKNSTPVRTGYALSAHQFLHDSLISEVELFQNLFCSIGLTEVYETLVQHPDKQETPSTALVRQTREHATSCVQLARYKGRGWLLTWPTVVNTNTTAPTHDAFVNMFRKRILVMDVSNGEGGGVIGSVEGPKKMEGPTLY